LVKGGEKRGNGRAGQKAFAVCLFCEGEEKEDPTVFRRGGREGGGAA